MILGIIFGPITNIINPDELFGEVLHPLIELAVILIVFEGGLTLNFKELSQIATSLKRLTSLGVLLSFFLGALIAHFFADLGWQISFLLSSILLVTGPTVIIPILRQTNLSKRAGSVIKWEGIINDPIGVLVATLVYQVIIYTGDVQVAFPITFGLLKAFIATSVLSVGGGFLLTLAFKKGHVPEFLKIPVTLTLVLVISAVSEVVQEGTGVLVATVIGIYLGNSRMAVLEELKRFKESASIFFISFIFILLAANLDPSYFDEEVLFKGLYLVAGFIILRFIVVFLSTIKTNLKTKEKLLISWCAPRGIVAASMAGVLSHLLEVHGYEEAKYLIPYVFMTIFITVILYSSTIHAVAKALGLAMPSGNGLVIVGASPWTTQLSLVLKEEEVPVLISDNSWFRLKKARLYGIHTHVGNLLADIERARVDLSPYSTLLAASENDAFNALVCTKLAPKFGWNSVYQLPLDDEASDVEDFPIGLSGTVINDIRISYENLLQLYYEGWLFKKTPLTEEFTYEDLQAEYPSAVHLISLGPKKEVRFIMQEPDFTVPSAGNVVISFVRPEEL